MASLSSIARGKTEPELFELAVAIWRRHPHPDVDVEALGHRWGLSETVLRLVWAWHVLALAIPDGPEYNVLRIHGMRVEVVRAHSDHAHEVRYVFPSVDRRPPLTWASIIPDVHWQRGTGPEQFRVYIDAAMRASLCRCWHELYPKPEFSSLPTEVT
jgi:hypothetical protein